MFRLAKNDELANLCFMVKKSHASVSAKNRTARVALTLAPGEPGQQPQPVSMPLSELIGYSSDGMHTCLNLTGRKVLRVTETTDQIDRLVRAAASQPVLF
jgi:hypothetical protein